MRRSLLPCAEWNSGGECVAPQEVSHRQETWVDVTVADSDDDVEHWGFDVRVFDPVESDEEFDSLEDAFQRHLEAGPRSKFENVEVDMSPNFHSGQERIQHLGHPLPWVWILVDQDHQTTTDDVGHMPVASTVGAS